MGPAAVREGRMCASASRQETQCQMCLPRSRCGLLGKPRRTVASAAPQPWQAEGPSANAGGLSEPSAIRERPEEGVCETPKCRRAIDVGIPRASTGSLPCKAYSTPHRKAGKTKTDDRRGGGPQTRPTPTPDVGAVREPPSQCQQHKETDQPHNRTRRIPQTQPAPYQAPCVNLPMPKSPIPVHNPSLRTQGNPIQTERAGDTRLCSCRPERSEGPGEEGRSHSSQGRGNPSPGPCANNSCPIP